LGFFFLSERRVRLTPRFVAFASPVRLSPRVFENPVSNETGFFVFLRERWQWKSFVERSATKIVTNSATEFRTDCFETSQ